jgi:hypothetical protein
VLILIIDEQAAILLVRPQPVLAHRVPHKLLNHSLHHLPASLRNQPHIIKIILVHCDLVRYQITNNFPQVSLPLLHIAWIHVHRLDATVFSKCIKEQPTCD